VSDIYGPDEIEDLLQDLNRLELAALDTEDYREFELAASSQEVGGGGALALRRLAGTCRSYAVAPPGRPGSSSSSCEVTPPPLLADANTPGVAARLRPSPAHSVRSWDSHTHYQHFKERMALNASKYISNTLCIYGYDMYYVHTMYKLT